MRNTTNLPIFHQDPNHILSTLVCLIQYEISFGYRISDPEICFHLTHLSAINPARQYAQRE